ncbi:MAG: outer membrane protein assembly factor BamD [Chitinophagales bacterium]|jgi:outer membrane protein assembly factor BamD|nr:outer membrane protein assembly factor BamD [Saprospirales bacterium]MBP6660558.1 outer membrane protein assembly factor BamD [Chitinophagales bacterium]
MFFKKSIYLLLFVSVLASCSRQYDKVFKGNNLEAKMKMADEQYAKKKYDKAIPIYEQLLTILKGQKSVDEIYYKYANSHYLNGSYELAAFYFRSFYNTYPASEHAEQAAFDEAMCYLKQSPRYSLEQTSTQKAIDGFQEFVNRYPKSTKMEQANAKIDELRGKLRKKSYESAYLYYKIGQYHAASVALTNFIKDFPEYENPEKIEYIAVKALKKYADGSYREKQEERQKESQKAFEAFKLKYPTSSYLPELEKMQLSKNKRIKK